MALLKSDFMGIPKIFTRSVDYLKNPKRLLRDTAGNRLAKKWKSIEKKDIVSIEDSMFTEVLRIQAEAFDNGSPEKLVKYSKDFRNVFYIIKSEGRIVGYCAYYLQPLLSLKGFKNQSVVSSIATDKTFRGRGFAERLLRSSIEEMKVNGISSVLLYVNVENFPAIKLYEKVGFQRIKQVNNICGQGQNCYEMELRLV